MGLFEPIEDLDWYKTDLMKLPWSNLKNRGRGMHALDPETRGNHLDNLSPILEVSNEMHNLMPLNSTPTVILLRSRANLKQRQHCHADNKKFYHELNQAQHKVKSYMDISYSCFYGLEENTYIGLASFDVESKTIRREVVKLEPGSMLLISGNMIHYGVGYRGSGTPDRAFSRQRPGLTDNFRCSSFIHPMWCIPDYQSQLWFLEGEDPKSIPHCQSDEDDDLGPNTAQLHTFSNY